MRSAYNVLEGKEVDCLQLAEEMVQWMILVNILRFTSEFPGRFTR